MDKGQGAEVSAQDDKQDGSSSGCGSGKTEEIPLLKEKEGLGGSGGGRIKTKVTTTEQKEHLQSEKSMADAAAATEGKEKEDGADVSTCSNENTSLTSSGELLESRGDSVKSSDPNLLSYLGLVKNGSEGKESQTAAAEPSPSVPQNPDSEEQSSRQGGKHSTDSPGQTSKPSPSQTAKPVMAILDVPVTVSPFSGSEDNSKPVDQIPGGSCGISEDQSINQTSSSTPRFIKYKLDQNEETIICCPVALLLQHKDYIDVTLKEGNKDLYSIKCCKCFHEDSEPYVMLEHLYEAHQIQGDLNKLLNLNSQHLGCMSHPECVNIPGVPTLPEGLSDLDNGVIRFNSMGIPRRSFACRLCPLNFTTSRGLLAHHQYFTRSVLSKESKDPCYSTFTCKVCPRQFANFLDYYAHHKWMRVSKNLFAKEKKVNIINNSGEVVACVSAALMLTEKTSSTTKFIWGFEANPTPEKNVQGYSIQSFNRTASSLSDSGADANELNARADSAKSLSEIQYVESSIHVGYLPKKQEKEEAKFGCGICLKTFPRLVQLQGHMGSHAKKQNPVSTTTYIVPAVEEPKDIEYKCGICSETFTKLSLLQNHMEGHCKPLKQKRLPVVSPFQSEAGSISETVTLISYACDICNRTFLSELKLWDHRLTHGPEAASKNTVLPSKKTDINRKKNHTCAVCKRSYYHKKSLNFHETKGPCKMKVPVFLAVQNAIQPVKKLEKHTRPAAEAKNKVDTWRKDGVRNSSKISLEGQARKNKEVVESKDDQDFPPPHVCDGCGKSFNLLWQLERHKGLRPKANRYQIQQGVEMAEMVIPKAPHTCNVCHQRFACFWQLKCHMGKRHGQLSKWLARTGDKSLTAKMKTLAQSAGSSQEDTKVSKNKAGDNVTNRKSAKAKRLHRLLAACRRSRRLKFYNTRDQNRKIQSVEPKTAKVPAVLQYKCNFCSKAFARKASLRSHKISHYKKMKKNSQETVSQVADESGKQDPSAKTSEDVTACDDKSHDLSCAPQSAEGTCSENNGAASEMDNEHSVAAVMDAEQETLSIVHDLEMSDAHDNLDPNEAAVTDAEQDTIPDVHDLKVNDKHDSLHCNVAAVTDAEQETVHVVQDLKINDNHDKLDSTVAEVKETEQETLPDIHDLKMVDEQNNLDCNVTGVRDAEQETLTMVHDLTVGDKNNKLDHNVAAVTNAEQETLPIVLDLKMDDKRDKLDCNRAAVTDAEQETLPVVHVLKLDDERKHLDCNMAEVMDVEQEILPVVHDLKMDGEPDKVDCDMAAVKETGPETLPDVHDDKLDKFDHYKGAVGETEQETLLIAPDSKKDKSSQASEETTCNELDLKSPTDNTKPSSPEENKSHKIKPGDAEYDQNHEVELKSSQRLSNDEQEPQTSSGEISSENKKVSSAESLNGEINSQPLRQVLHDLIEYQFSDKNPSRNCALEKRHSANVSSSETEPETTKTRQDEGSKSSVFGTVLLTEKLVEGVSSQSSLSNSSNEELKQQPPNTTDKVDLSSMEVTPDENNLKLSDENKTDFHSSGKDASTNTEPPETSLSDVMDTQSSEKNLSEGASTQGLSDSSGEKTLHICLSDITEPSTMEVETSDKDVPGCSRTSMEIPQESDPYVVVVETIVDDSEVQTETDFRSYESSYQNIPHRNNSNNRCVEGSSDNTDSKLVSSSSGALSFEVSDTITSTQSSKESTTTMTNPASVQTLQSEETGDQALEDDSQVTIQTDFVGTGTSKMFTCDVCSKTYLKSIQLNAHKRCHGKRKRRKKKGYRPRPYIRKTNGNAKFRCEICGASFNEHKKLMDHKGAHARDKSVDSFKNHPTTELESSKELQSQAVDAGDTNLQVQSAFDETSDGITQNNNKSSATLPASVQEKELLKAASKVAMVTSSSFKKMGKYFCEKCTKSFKRFAQLKCHMTSHLVEQPALSKSEKPYYCKVCKVKFVTTRGLLLHMKKHYDEKECELLRQKMALQDTDHSYYKQVFDDTSKKNRNTKSSWSFSNFSHRTLTCPYCPKTYAKQCHLSNHMNVHKIYRCTLCRASFWSQRQLSCHFEYHKGSQKRNADTGITQDSGLEANYVPVSLSGKQTDTTPSSGTVVPLACNLSSVILKKILRVFLSGLNHKKKRAVNQRSKWFQPKWSLQRVALKCHQDRLQKILGALRKAIIMEIEADTHKVVYDCTECRKSSFCHKAILRHFLDKHLPQTEERTEKPASPEVGEESVSPHQRFRNCPICKGSSGFQCHLHNTAEHIDLAESSGKKGTLFCDLCNQKFRHKSGLVRHRKTHKSKKAQGTINCQFCSYTAVSRHALAAHLRVHKENHSQYTNNENAKGIRQLGKVVKLGNVVKLVRIPFVDPRGCYTCRTCGKYYHSVKAFKNHTLEHEADGKSNAQPENSSNPNKNGSNPDEKSSIPIENNGNPNSQHGGVVHPSLQGLNTTLQKRDSRNLTLQHSTTNSTNSPDTQRGNGSNPTTQHEDNSTPNSQNSNSSYGDKTGSAVQHLDTSNLAMQSDVSSNATLLTEENNTTRRKKKKHSLFKQPGLNLPFKCAQCVEAFKTANELWDHINKEHTSKNRYSCTKCAFSTDSPFSLQRHQKKHPETSLNKRKWHSYLKDVLHSSFTPHASPPTTPTKLTHKSPRSEKSQSDVVSPDKTGEAETETQLGFSETVESPVPDVGAVKTVSQLPAGYDTLQSSGGSSWMSVESPDEYFACSQCKDFRASTQQEWDQHIETVHKGNNTDKLSCKMCQYTTTSKERLERHVRLHRRMTLQCDTCPYRTPQRHQMIRHVQTVHKQQKPFKCKNCSYSTAYNHHLRRHMEKHKNPNFRCRYRKFMKNGDWHKIETAKGNGGVICKECGCELRNKKTLRRHQIKKHFRITGAAPPGTLGPSPDVQRSFTVIQAQPGNTEQPQPLAGLVQNLSKPFQCPICAMVFKRRCDLNQHVTKGHPKKGTSLPSQCPQCGLVTGSGQLEDHMKIHEEENLLSCNEEGCQFKTAESVHLQRHQTKHAAQKEALNTCRPCQMTFPDPSSLEVHNNQHHSKLLYNISIKDPFLCTHCPYRSPCEKDANRHWKLHNYSLPFKCEYCVFSTSTAAAIATHRKIHSHSRRNSSTFYVAKRGSKNRKMRSTDNEGSPKSGKAGVSSLPRHVFMSTQGKKLYECRYCQRFFEVAEAWQRHELRHMAEWPQC